MGILPDGSFIQPAPHILFVHDEDGKSWLKERVAKLKDLPAFAATEYTEDYDTIKSWVGLLCSGRKKESKEPIACSRHPDGTEVNYGLLTRQLVQSLIELGGDVQLLSTVTALQQQPDKSWLVAVKKNDLTASNQTVKAKFVFAASGGGSLRILQMAGIPEVNGYGGMPVSGKFLVCQKPEIIEQNRNKVYGRAAIGAPPMSVPHLDWRTIYGKDCIFFGPFAGFSPAVFKMSGSPLDWLSTFNLTNILPMAAMGLQNLDLVKYLVGEVFSSRDAQLEALRKFVPDAKPEDWTMVWAGQRIQIVKPDPKVIGKLEFGTEVLSSADGTIVGLLGASPGASVSPHIAIEVINKFNSGTNNAFNWHVALSQWIPSYGRDINAEPGLYDQVMSKARAVLLEGKSSGYRTGMQHSNHLFDRIDMDGDGALSPTEITAYLNRHTSMHPTQIQSLVEALDADKDGAVSREEFDKGFTKIVANLVRRGTINRMEEVKKIAEETKVRVARSTSQAGDKKEKDPSIKIASSKD
jgi:malate dehydrogenase (quinone)